MAMSALQGGAAVRTLIGAGVVVGALTSPFVAVYTILLGIPAAAFGLVVGASLYFLLAVVVSAAG